MKKILISLWLCGLVAMFASAGQQIGDYTWSYTVYFGGQRAQINSVSPKSGDIVVPSVIGSLPVMCIGNGAFTEGVDIRSIVIPESVARLDREVFYKCSNMTDLVIPSSVRSIDVNAFYGCNNLKNVTLPSNISI